MYIYKLRYINVGTSVITELLPEGRGGEMGILGCSGASKLDIHSREQEKAYLKTEGRQWHTKLYSNLHICGKAQAQTQPHSQTCTHNTHHTYHIYHTIHTHRHRHFTPY